MRTTIKALAGAAVLSLMLSSVGAAQAMRSGFDANGLAGNDDGSTGLVSVGFTLNFFGTDYTQVYVNNNGNITFTGADGTFTPSGITGSSQPRIAPFFADVDTRLGPLTTYGSGTVGTQGAWGVTWNGVCYYYTHCFDQTNADQTNAFQLVLVNRSDIGAGDFDIEFNYNKVLWETGDASGGVNGLGGTSAHAGWSNGTGTYAELAGSGVNGAFLDGGPNALISHRLNSDMDGRYLWNVRNGVVEDVVPEPVSMILLGTGLLGIGLARRRRTKEVA